MLKYDVIIAGGGPAGTSCALSLPDSGLKVLLLDKASFPRDKICGDALSVDVINQLAILSANAAASFQKLNPKLSSSGVRIISPDASMLDIPFLNKGNFKTGFICAREYFDQFLMNEVKAQDKIQVLEDCLIASIKTGTNGVEVFTNKGTYSAEMLIGADGANSVVRRTISKSALDRRNHSAGLRVYYKGVEGLHPQNYIELHFFKEILPGYLWIFPMADGKANVGIGVLSSEISRKKMNLKAILQRQIAADKSLSDRFRNAIPLEEMKGFGLPLGDTQRSISGERILLTGDAAGLIDPFSGEGIGNAIRSGRVAADHLLECFRIKNFTAQNNLKYDREIYRRMGNEFMISKRLQQLCRYPALFNFVVRKAAGNKYLQQFFMEALADVDVKKKLLKPGFYYNMLFK